MALVAYDYDSSSEDDDCSNEIKNTNSIPSISQENASKIEVKVDTPDNLDFQLDETGSNTILTSGTNLFSTLPPERLVKNIEEGQIEHFVPKSTSKGINKQKVRITIPSLSQFADEEDEPSLKKCKSSSKGSGLISILPPVKGTVTTAKSFIPKAVANKSKNVIHTSSVQSHNLLPHVIRKQADAKKAAVLRNLQENKAKIVLSDAESDDDIELPESFDDEMWEKVCGRPKPKLVIREPEEPIHQVLDIAPEPEKQYDGLDNKAFKELVGKSRRPIGNIKLIDINEADILLDKDLWMMKSLTDPELAPKPEVEDPVDPTRRRKHHITYLAQQAKANEQELQNAWAASKNIKMATRAKYGF